MFVCKRGGVYLQGSPWRRFWLSSCKQNPAISSLMKTDLDLFKPNMPPVKPEDKCTTSTARRPSSVGWGNGVGMIKLNPLSRLSPSSPNPPPVPAAAVTPPSPLSIVARPVTRSPEYDMEQDGKKNESYDLGLFSAVSRRCGSDTSTETLVNNNSEFEHSTSNEMYDSGISLSAISPKTESSDILNKMMVQSISSDSGWTVAGSETDCDQNIGFIGDLQSDSPNVLSKKRMDNFERDLPTQLHSDIMTIRPPGISGLNMRVSATPPRDMVPRSRSEPMKLAQLGNCSLKESNSFHDGEFKKPMLPVRISGPPTSRRKKKKVLSSLLLNKVTEYVRCQNNDLSFTNEDITPKSSCPIHNHILGELTIPAGKRYTKLHMPGSRLPEMLDSLSESDIDSEHGDISPVGICDNALSQQDCLELSWDDHDLSAFIPEVPDGYSCFKTGPFHDLDLGDSGPSYSSARSSSVSPEAPGKQEPQKTNKRFNIRKKMKKPSQKNSQNINNITLVDQEKTVGHDTHEKNAKSKPLAKPVVSASEMDISGLFSGPSEILDVVNSVPECVGGSDQVDQESKRPQRKAAKKRKNKKKKDREQDEEEEQEDGAQKSKKPKKIPPNYFVAIQVSDPKIISSLKMVQQSVTDQKPGLAPAVIPLPTLHLTLYVTHLAQPEDIQRAKAALDACYEKLRHLEDTPVDLTVSGLGNFRNNVVFAKVLPDSALDRLNLISSVVCECFAEQNVPPSDNKGFKPHCTIMKLSRSPKLKKKGISKIEPEFYKQYEEDLFGHQRVQDLQLCSMFKPKDQAGYYYVEYAVPLAKTTSFPSGSSTSPPPSDVPLCCETDNDETATAMKSDIKQEVDSTQKAICDANLDKIKLESIDEQTGTYQVELSCPLAWDFHPIRGCYGNDTVLLDQSKEIESSDKLGPSSVPQLAISDISLPDPELYVVKLNQNLVWNFKEDFGTKTMDVDNAPQP